MTTRRVFAELWHGTIQVATVGDYQSIAAEPLLKSVCARYEGQTMQAYSDDLRERFGIVGGSNPMPIDTKVHNWDQTVDYWEIIEEIPRNDGEGNGFYRLATSDD